MRGPSSPSRLADPARGGRDFRVIDDRDSVLATVTRAFFSTAILWRRRRALCRKGSDTACRSDNGCGAICSSTRVTRLSDAAARWQRSRDRQPCSQDGPRPPSDAASGMAGKRRLASPSSRNGITIIDDGKISPTPAGSANRGGRGRSPHAQDHGNAVQYRHLWLKPLDD